MAKKRQQQSSGFWDFRRSVTALALVAMVAALVYVFSTDEADTAKDTGAKSSALAQTKQAANSAAKKSEKAPLKIEHKKSEKASEKSAAKKPVQKPLEPSAFGDEAQVAKVLANYKGADDKAALKINEVKTDIQSSKITEQNKSAKTAQSALLAIIIDDVATPAQAQQIADIKRSGLFLTPSFMPPSAAHPSTPQLAKEFGKDFMLHLPLEALAFAHPEPDTLLASDSCERIKKRVDEMFSAFKGLRIINNHTGSKFTQSEHAMRCLLRSIYAHGGVFIDSRTSALTVVPRLSEEFKRAYVARDVFLDNDPSLVAQQLAVACAKARSKGAAIAIAHPHPSTLAALRAFKGCERAQIVSVREILHRFGYE